MTKEIINKKTKENAKSLLDDFIKSVKREYAIHTIIAFFFILINVSSFLILKHYNYQISSIWSKSDCLYVICGCTFTIFSVLQFFMIIGDKRDLKNKISRLSRQRAEYLSEHEKMQFFESKDKTPLIVSVAYSVIIVNIIFMLIRIIFLF